MGDAPPSLSPAAFVVRDSTEPDMAAIQRIYAHYVLNGLATFEEAPPPVEEMIARRKKVLDLGLPYLVADSGGDVIGYCYAARTTVAPPIATRSRIRSMSRTVSAAAASAPRCSAP